MKLLDEPTVDEWGVVTIGRWGGWLVQVMPMIFNDRLVLTPEWFEGCFYDYGWCYPKGGAAHLAAMAWNPEAEAEPSGYIKRVGWRTRKAGETASDGGSDAAIPKHTAPATLKEIEAQL